jgi:hypothetical protein
MNKQVFVLLLAFIAIQVNSTVLKAPRDLVDEAERQLEELKSTVQGQIIVAHNDLQTIEVDFLSNSNNILQQAVIAIQQEQSTVDEQITQIKELAHAANEDISSCTDIREELLSRLPAEYNEMLRNCIFGKNREEARVVADAKYIVDVAVNKVHNLEFQFRQCRDDLLCLSPLITEIELDKIRLPQNIRTEVSAAQALLTTLKLSVAQCSDQNVSEYTSDANAILQDIISCADRIIG